MCVMRCHDGQWNAPHTATSVPCSSTGQLLSRGGASKLSLRLGCRDGRHLERQYVLNVKAQVALVCGRFHGQGDLDAFVAKALS